MAKKAATKKTQRKRPRAASPSEPADIEDEADETTEAALEAKMAEARQRKIKACAAELDAVLEHHGCALEAVPYAEIKQDPSGGMYTVWNARARVIIRPKDPQS